jgi:hypothetical protein
VLVAAHKWALAEGAAAGFGDKDEHERQAAAIGQLPQPLHSKPNVPDRCSQLNRATTRADQIRTKG